MQPFEVDFSSIGAAIETFFNVVGAILNRERGIIAEIHDEPGVLVLSLVIVLIAGLSERLAQSFILFANEVSPRRFIYSLLIGTLLFLGGYALWVISIWLIALLVFKPEASLLDVVRAVGLGYAPLFFGFLGLIPYFGSGILTLLYFWVFVVIVAAVSAVLGIPPVQSIAVSAGGGLIILVMRATIGKPFVKMARRLRNLAAGKRLNLKIQSAVEQRSFDALFEWVDEEQPK